ncbi:MAG: RNA polymerase sigma factor [Solirubrobacteraceae bacterium]|nr:RNA polymerase sigma factor [Solirubrobacteraceae bacterium]
MSLSSEQLARVYDAHAREFVAFFARRVYDPEVAVDLTAETFAAAFVGGDSFTGKTDEDAVRWLYGIAKNQVAGFWRAGQVEQRAVERLGMQQRRGLTDEEYERIEELAALGDLRRRVAAELEAMPAEHAEVLRLRVVQELDYPVLAARLEISEQTARARVSRALRALAVRLEPYLPTEEGSHA